MVLLTVPEFFFTPWFWLILIAVIITIHYFWGKTPLPPKPSKFFSEHKKTITKIGDIFLIFIILLLCLPWFSFLIDTVLKAASEHDKIGTPELRFICSIFLILMIASSGIAAGPIGFLSVFRSNLTKAKRIILLIISLLPLIFTIINLLIAPAENLWSLVKLGLIYSSTGWIINGPAIITGKHFSRVSWAIMCKLRMASGDYPE
jgi:hypothetical protein